MCTAAVLYRNGREIKVMHKHLGTEEEHTVFKAEIVGGIIGVHMVSAEDAETGITICLDSQTKISTTIAEKQNYTWSTRSRKA